MRRAELAVALLIGCTADPPPAPAPAAPVQAWEWGARAVQADGTRRYDAQRLPQRKFDMADGIQMAIGIVMCGVGFLLVGFF